MINIENVFFFPKFRNDTLSDHARWHIEGNTILTGGTSKYNTVNALVTAHLLPDLNKNLPNLDSSIITLYKAQNNLYKQIVRDLGRHGVNIRRVDLRTIDGHQGSEVTLVIPINRFMRPCADLYISSLVSEVPHGTALLEHCRFRKTCLGTGCEYAQMRG